MNEITGDLVLKMPLAIINGIAEGLHNNLQTAMPIYTNNVEALNKEAGNCFYINGPISITEENYLQDRAKLRLLFDVSCYFTKRTDSGKKMVVSSLMRDCLKQIQPCLMIENKMVNIGPTKAGFNISAELVDGDIHVTVGYDVWLDREFEKEFVQTLFINEDNKE